MGLLYSLQYIAEMVAILMALCWVEDLRVFKNYKPLYDILIENIECIV